MRSGVSSLVEVARYPLIWPATYICTTPGLARYPLIRPTTYIWYPLIRPTTYIPRFIP
jgi:hypothetical protein